MNLQKKLTIIIIGIVLIPGLVAYFTVQKSLEHASKEEATSYGLPIAQQIAKNAAPLVILQQRQAIHELITQARDPRISYIVITNPQQRILANTGKIPTKLPPLTGQATLAEVDGEELYAISSKLPQELGEVTIGINTKMPTSNILPLIILSTILAAITAIYTTSRIVSPLRQIYNSAHELSQGNFNTRINVKTGDELEELGNTFNQATEALGRIDQERKQIDQAKTRFLSITSHELRSPMTPMKAQLQMLGQGYYGKLGTKQKQSVEMVLRNADRLDSIIGDFLEISRIEAARLRFTFQKTNIAEIVLDVVKYMNTFMPDKKVSLTTKLGKLPVIEADPNRISQVLRNLLSNAIKFSQPNSTVTIAAAVNGEFIEFSVRDTGIGISQKDQAKLFEPFFQAEQTIYREGKGVGLGLAICRGIVLSQNGKIWVESQPGKGSTFFFTLPLTPVKEIRPIRVLFSSKEAIDRKIKEAFKEMLGPIGSSEFDDLRQNLTHESLRNYVDELRKRNIITPELAEQFKHRVNHALMADVHHVK
ncbi:HAMP domain-containing histidine kinase [Candidatus Woesearchaeota archaeon]|nr:HAMP domain-containing histidine kinase [Candidatus Woesearchaeota archaeon]